MAFTLQAAPSELEGDLSRVTLSPGGKTYLVRKEITVPAGAAITLPAGTVLLFDAFSGMKVEGALTIDGTAQKPVVCTSINDTTWNPSAAADAMAFDWNGVFIGEKAGPIRISHLTLRYSVFGIKTLTPDIAVREALFSQNGQFHFAQGDTVKLVHENVPFFYHDDLFAPVRPPVTASEEFLPVAKRLPWIVAGSGGALCVAGLIFTVSALRHFDAAEKAELQQEYESEQDRYRTTRAAGISLLSTGAAGVTVGVLLGLYRKRTHASH